MLTMTQAANKRSGLLSGVTKKYVMALTGLGLLGFVVLHLLGNLLFYAPDSSAINVYSHKLVSTGPLLIVAEIGLLVIAIVHVVTALALTFGYRAARPERYGMWRSKASATKVTDRGGGEDAGVKIPEAQPSNLASRNMVWTGVVLLVFIVIHVVHIKFGPGVAEGYVVTNDGVEMRDLNRFVHETFRNPINVAFYCLSMIFLGFHLRHGFWSAIQSLGLMCPKHSKCIHGVGLALAVALAAGFFFIPIYLFVTAGPGGLR